MTVTGAGFTPGDTVDLEATGVFTTAAVDPTGAFAAQAAAPLLGTINPAQQAVTLTATSETSGAVMASVQLNIATFAVATKPAQARPSKRVRFTFSGFAPGRPIFAHYVRGGKVRATTRFGTAAFPCGTLTAHARLYPASHPATGTYHVQFDSSRSYSSHTAQKLVATLRIFKTFVF
jgi:hypothetical protein